MKSKWKRIIASTLAIAFLLANLGTALATHPDNVLLVASQSDVTFAEQQETPKYDFGQSEQAVSIGEEVVGTSDEIEPEIVAEETDRRDENSKHFRQSDGTYQAVIYPYAVHYKDGETWEEIDNTLVESKDKKGRKAYSNKRNSFKAYFSDSLDSSKMQMTIQKDQYELSWAVQNAEEKAPVAVETVVTDDAALLDVDTTEASITTQANGKASKGNTNGKGRAKQRGKGRPGVPKNLESSISYKKALKNADLQYDVQSSQVKESITLNAAPTESLEYRYVLSYKNLTPKLQSDNSVIFTDDETGDEVFLLAAPFMTDANGEVSHDIKVTLNDEAVKMSDMSALTDEKESLPDAIVATPTPEESSTPLLTATPTPTPAPTEMPQPDATDTPDPTVNSESDISLDTQEEQQENSSDDLMSMLIVDPVDDGTSEDSGETEPEAVTGGDQDVEDLGDLSEEATESPTPSEAPTPTPTPTSVPTETPLPTDEPKDEKLTTIRTLVYSIEPSAEWLGSSERKYPVEIDPTVTMQSSSGLEDASVSSGAPTTNFCNTATLPIGRNGTAINRAYLKYNFPASSFPGFTNGERYNVVNAQLSLYYETNQAGNCLISAHEVTSDWYSGQISWNNQPTFEADASEVVKTTAGYANCILDITKIADKWFNPTGGNKGFVIKNVDESIGYSVMKSYENATTAQRPILYLTYISRYGIEPSYTYHTQGVGLAGTGYVNDMTGQLTFVRDEVSLSGNLMPTQLKSVFIPTRNGSYQGGLWKFNYDQKVFVASGLTGYYVHEDGDFTQHFYKQKSANVYENEQNKDLTLTVVSSSQIIISDKNGSKLEFTSGGRLTKITDQNGNQLTIQFDGRSRLGTITDGAGRVTTIEYFSDSSVFPSRINSPDGRDVIFTKAEAQTSTRVGPDRRIQTMIVQPEHISSATYADGETVTYQYSFGHFIAKNSDGYSVEYIGPPYVSKILERQDEISGNSLEIQYGHLWTKFQDNKGRYSIYQFDSNGHTVSVTNDDGTAAYQSFSNTIGNTDRIASVSGAQQSIIGLYAFNSINGYGNVTTVIRPGSKDRPATTQTDTSMGTVSWGTGRNNVGLSIQVNKVLTSGGMAMVYPFTSVLEAGKTYTVSAYVKTNGMGNAGGARLVAYGESMVVGPYKLDYMPSEVGSSNYLNGGSQEGEWTRIQASFVMPSTPLAIGFEIRDTIGSACFADVQLEESEVANRLNYVKLPQMKTSGFNYSGSTDGDTHVEIPAGESLPQKGGRAFKFVGNYNTSKTAWMNFGLKGQAGDSFVFGGWTKANALPKKADGSGIWRMRFGFKKSTGQYDYTDIDISCFPNDWQYVCGGAVAKEAYTDVQLMFEYGKNANEAFIAYPQVYREEFSQSYTYDSNGNVVSVSAEANKKGTFEWNSTSDLTKFVSPTGSQFTYTYDNNHNLKTAQTPVMDYSFLYDAKGNVTETRAGKNNETVYAGATYTANGNFIASTISSKNTTTTYNTDPNKGVLLSATDPSGKSISYTYDSMLRLTRTEQNTSSGTSFVQNTYQGGRLVGTNNNSVSYTLGYDQWGSATSVSVGGNTLVTRQYDPQDRKLLSSTYANGQAISYEYDSKDRIVGVKLNGQTILKNSYDAFGSVARSYDAITGKTFTTSGDLTSRTSQTQIDDGSKWINSFDQKNNLSGTEQTLLGQTSVSSFTYDDAGRPKMSQITPTKGGQSFSVTHSYDNVGNTSSYVYSLPKTTGTTSFTTSVTRETSVKGKTHIVSTYRNGSASPYQYQYDILGRISTFTQGGKQARYAYDDLGQLSREDNGFTNQTITYTYDFGGNIQSKSEYAYTTASSLGAPTRIVTYSYGNNSWKDQMTAFDGNAITYDGLGNPLSYAGYTFGWTQVNKLSRLSGNGKSITYDYDAGGERFKKTVNGVTTEYSYLSGQLQAMKTGADLSYFHYSSSGMRLAIQYKGTLYYYLYNAQGDVVGLIDCNGATVVEYIYDSWGKLVSTAGSLASTLGKDNPFRFRDYFYDEETGWYYLHNRYYVPDWGRFLNADSSVYTSAIALSMNQYAYCVNDPVDNFDPSGKAPIEVPDDFDWRTVDLWDYPMYGRPIPEGTIQAEMRKLSIVCSIIGVWRLGSSGSSSSSITTGYWEQSNAAIIKSPPQLTEIPGGGYIIKTQTIFTDDDALKRIKEHENRGTNSSRGAAATTLAASILAILKELGEKASYELAIGAAVYSYTAGKNSSRWGANAKNANAGYRNDGFIEVHVVIFAPSPYGGFVASEDYVHYPYLPGRE